MGELGTSDEIASVSSSTLAIPLPHDIDGIQQSDSFELFGGSEMSEKSLNCETDGYAESPVSVEETAADKPLSDRDRQNLHSMIADSTLSVKPVFAFKMPSDFEQRPKGSHPNSSLETGGSPEGVWC